MAALRSSKPLFAAVLAAVAIATGTCGSDAQPEDGGSASKDPAPTVAAKDLPKPLADNQEEANQLIDGSSEALEAKLADLRGHPVVVNQWGSWCPPCRAEFPFFAEVADEHAEEVAFVGVDIQDDREAAEEFLADFSVPYPSIYDPDADAVRSLDWAGFSPTTWFIDERGETVFVRNGAYPDEGTLNADVHLYLLAD